MKTFSKIFTISFFSLLLPSLSAHATQFLDLSISNYGNVPSAAHGALDTAINQIETDINNNFPNVNLGPFTQGSARSAALATSGIGTEYASDFDFGYLSVNAGLSTDATFTQMKNLADGSASITDFPGAGAAFGITLGLSLKHLPAIPLVSQVFSPDRTRGYLTFFSTSKSFTADSATAASFDVGTKVFAAQGQYKIIKGTSIGLGTLKWGGIDLGGGIRYSSQSLNVTKSLNGITQTADLESSAPGFGTATLAFSGNAIVGINSKAFTIPLEVSTSARLLHVLGIFVGTGADINLGSANSALSIDSPIDIDNAGAGTPLSGVTAQADANLSESAKPTLTNLKYFAGVQIELLAVGFSVQYTGSVVDSSKAVNAGVKLFW